VLGEVGSGKARARRRNFIGRGKAKSVVKAMNDLSLQGANVAKAETLFEFKTQAKPRISMNVEDVIKKIGDLAYYYELTYHGCSQCVLKAIQDSLNIGNSLTFKAATAFAGGVAEAGEICGALIGGIMAISLVFGRDRLEDAMTSSGLLKAMELSIRLYEEFKKEFGSVKCHDIQKKLFGRSFNLRDEEDKRRFIEAGAHGPSGCPQVVRKGAMLAAKIILENLNLLR